MKQELVEFTIRMPPKLKRKLERLSKKRGLSQAKYLCTLLEGKSSEAVPPKQFWDVMQQLYSIHEMLLRDGNQSAAEQLQQSIVSLQCAFTLEVP